jgi:rhodanese-related sulfurtransferase
MFKKAILFIGLICSFFTFAQETAEISQQEVMSLIKASDAKPFVILDVRTAEEYNEGHIPGAINISHNEVANNIANLAQYKDKLVVVHCRSGRRAAYAENILAKAGFNHLKHLSGDMNGWQAANLPLEK